MVTRMKTASINMITTVLLLATSFAAITPPENVPGNRSVQEIPIINQVPTPQVVINEPTLDFYVGGGYIYWSTCVFTPTSPTTHIYVKRRPEHGGETMILSQWSSTSCVLKSHMVADETGLFFVNKNYALEFRPVNAPTSPKLLHNFGQNPDMNKIVLDQQDKNYLFWVQRFPGSTNGHIQRLNKAGGTPVTLYVGNVWDIAPFSGGIYWIEQNSIWDLYKYCSPPCGKSLFASLPASSSNHSRDLVIDQQRMIFYWVNDDGNGDRRIAAYYLTTSLEGVVKTLYVAPPDGPDPEEPFTTSYIGPLTLGPCPGVGWPSDECYLYWSVRYININPRSELLRMPSNPAESHAPEVLTEGIFSSWPVITVGKDVYFRLMNDKVARLSFEYENKIFLPVMSK